MDVTIEKMTLAGFSTIEPILSTSFDDFWNATTLKEELQCANSHYFVAKYANEIVGFAGIKVILKEADIMNVVVKHSHRNQKIGHQLLQQLITFCESLPLDSITLEVNEENLVAIHLYESFGFQIIGLRKNYYQNKNGIIMTKKLN